MQTHRFGDPERRLQSPAAVVAPLFVAPLKLTLLRRQTLTASNSRQTEPNGAGTIRLIWSREVRHEATVADTRRVDRHGRAGLGADYWCGLDAWQHRLAGWDHRPARGGHGGRGVSGRTP